MFKMDTNYLIVMHHATKQSNHTIHQSYLSEANTVRAWIKIIYIYIKSFFIALIN